SGDKLQEYQNQAASQESKISSFFQLNPGEIFSPWEVQSLVFKTKTPITSVRRSMSDLTKVGILTKTEHLKEAGNYGRRSYAWMLNEKYYETLQAMDAIMAPVEAPVGDLKDNYSLRGIITTYAPRSDNGLNSQGTLFDVPIVGHRCNICNRILSNPKSIDRGIGPVCNGKCMEDGL
ncbi:hypothetical protein LCGC14_1990080, partial [marine sediment metagenome]